MWSLYPCPTTWFEPYIMILKSRANQTRKRTRVDRLNKILKEEKKIHMKQLQRKKCRWTLVLGTTWKWISNWHWHRFECVALKVLCLVSSQFCQKKNHCTLTTTITVHIMCRDIIITICHLNFEGESTTNYIKVVFFCRIRFFFFVRSIGLLSRI